MCMEKRDLSYRHEAQTDASEDTLQLIRFQLQQWPSRSSKVDDVHLIWKSACDFLLVINSNLSPFSYYLATIVHTEL